MTVNGVSSGRSAINRQSAAMDRAAEKIARASTAGQASLTPASAGIERAQESQPLDGTVEMMVAKRMFTAAVRMAQTANEGVREALRAGGYDAAA